jgi:glutaredoxin-dependent peroxiredoxin
MAIGLGAVAPDFTLQTKDDLGLREVTLSAHRGKENVVLLFFPGAFTPSSTEQMCDITSGIDKYSALDAVVYGVSPDSVFALQEWAKKCGIGVTLLADYQREAIKAYEVEVEDFEGMGRGSAHAVIVVDKNGIVKHAEQTESLADVPDFEAVRLVLEGIG